MNVTDTQRNKLNKVEFSNTIVTLCQLPLGNIGNLEVLQCLATLTLNGLEIFYVSYPHLS